ncbi:AraC family transcriptional regulator [Methylobacterium nonmethylotrophicum]|uniref:AraC family transcriptional regulator n=1 Tax=Methylobacterium nonmethylotrophicum TaxID=1141884 RepID=A0A4Z0NX89_9HYPH|nr:AraC family transcriptional regulator [Methylobacterium nonmethylotrophicum]TGE02459.1 AraC family transcriptional regulator [Methylobacterium nonmethylotrophicum]
MRKRLAPHHRALVTSETCDPDDAVSRVAEVFCPHRLRIHRLDAPFKCDLTVRNIAPLKIVDLSYGTSVQVEPENFGTFFLITSTLTGDGTAFSGAHEQSLCARQTVVFSPDAPIRFHFGPRFKQKTLHIRKDVFEQAWIRFFDRPMPTTLNLAPCVLPENFSTPWDMFMGFADSLLQFESLRTTAAQRATDAAMDLILEAMQARFSEALAGIPAAKPAQLRRAEEFIVHHAAEPISSRRIATAAGCSYRALQIAFRRHLGTTPKAFLTDVRLSLARTEITSGQFVSVTEVAMRYGFYHIGRFSKLYRDRYGELPSETFRRSKNA